METALGCLLLWILCGCHMLDEAHRGHGVWVPSCPESYSQQACPSEWVGRSGASRRGVPALLAPGVVPLDEAFGALQLRMQAVLLAPVPGHALGGYAETEQNAVQG